MKGFIAVGGEKAGSLESQAFNLFDGYPISVGAGSLVIDFNRDYYLILKQLLRYRIHCQGVHMDLERIE